MITREDRKPAGDKKVHFPPPRKLDPEEIWRFPCLAGRECTEKHSSAKGEVFKKMTPRQRLDRVEEKDLCTLCFRHLATRDCWAKGKLPNCHIRGCGGQHGHLLRDALVQGRALVQEVM
jgi:hypothetical protein